MPTKDWRGERSGSARQRSLEFDVAAAHCDGHVGGLKRWNAISDDDLVAGLHMGGVFTLLMDGVWPGQRGGRPGRPGRVHGELTIDRVASLLASQSHSLWALHVGHC